MTTTERIELARVWLKTCRENLWGPANRWTGHNFIEYERDQRLLVDFLTDMEAELWPSTDLSGPELDASDMNDHRRDIGRPGQQSVAAEQS